MLPVPPLASILIFGDLKIPHKQLVHSIRTDEEGTLISSLVFLTQRDIAKSSETSFSYLALKDNSLYY